MLLPARDKLSAPATLSRLLRGRALQEVLLRPILRLGMLAAGVAFPSVVSAAGPPPMSTSGSAFPATGVSADARRMVAWVIAGGDNRHTPFVVVDKIKATAWAFDRQGQLVGTAPVLLGTGSGDTSPDGIGTRKLSTISPAERITPAGRFVAALGENLSGRSILWVDYDAALSLHPVDTAKPAERRLQRLATPSVADNRISYGCINVPSRFFETVVAPLFKGTVGIVYILPEARSVDEVFFEEVAG